ncbi:efflux RND transporter periplasmic adaptor subunit [Candidatus Nitronereus thalassa]|uniref:Efflux RND transporter periplasmic adaptor subunit n=1 Tax=Candidatus Nitronereus thalassa TaxID=3020898 RepID=A0ABU3K2X3_9BACT|nr:efflux RND transporter periplasmic adaptor subunit [Candidatus Nitronereus thalassa]MDT7040719.1 efflux RND transporter periplasmic adaptor subunit [Candidatus Nitronereus thalassa]
MSEFKKISPLREEDNDRAETPDDIRPFRQDEAHSKHSKRFWIIIGIIAVVLGSGIGFYYWSTGTEKHTAHLPGGETQTAKSEHQGMDMSSTGGEAGMKPEEPESVMINARKQQLIGVKTEKAKSLTITHTIRTVALVDVDERNLEHVNIKLEGWVEKLYVRFTGEDVKKDQMLFEIYSPELVSSQEEYLLALKAVRTLGDSEFSEVADSARRVLQSTRERFSLWDITPDHIEDLERTGKVLRTLPLHAPISGYVLTMNVREGGYITPSTDTFVLADLSNIWVLADLYEFEIPYVKLGQKAQITLPYFPNEIFKGTVTYIYPVLDPKTRTVKVRFELPNPGWRLKPDMFANVTLEIPLGDRLVVPNTAVLDSGTKQVVFVDTGQGMFEARNVTLGVRSREWYEVLEGVKEGEMVVTSGNFLIDSESALGSATGMMMPGMDMGPKKGDDSSDAMSDMKP